MNHDLLAIPGITIDHILEEVATLDLFRDVDLVSIKHLLDHCELTHVEAGATVLEKGDQNRAIFQIIAGKLQVRLREGNEIALVPLGRGACAGELSILSRLDVSAQVVALEETRLLVIPEELVWAMINGSHEFSRNLLQVLAGRVRDSNHRLCVSVNAQEQHARASRIDALTGTYNRRGLDEILERECRRCQRDQVLLVAMLIDVDHFKSVNDRYGHLIGDEVLCAVAERLGYALSPTDLLARFGGEEFVILLLGRAMPEAKKIADRLRREIERTPILTSSGPIEMTVSIGVTCLEGGDGPRDLLGRADVALYRAKQSGRNSTVAIL
jgi:diguanylate cyclase (GGDEF)-like protein